MESKKDCAGQDVCCEVCGSHNLTKVLDLGMNPLCDDLIPIGRKEKCVEYPIEILYCDRCRTAHQVCQPDNKMLFPKEYHYRARFTQDVLNGMRGFVESCQKYGSLKGKKVLDIGCNDGSLLSFFLEKGAYTVGVEPTNAALDVPSEDIHVVNDYFSVDAAKKVREKYGTFDFITFTNVFAHIKDIGSLLEGVRILMNDDTVLAIENHYLGGVLAKKQFDTFYHEHPRTYSLTSFAFIAERLGCTIDSAEFPSRYGGNIRVFIRKKTEQEGYDAAIEKQMADEAKFKAEFKSMRESIEKWKMEKGTLIQKLVKEYGPIPAKAFPGRAAILIRQLGLDERHISAIYEKTGSSKIGCYVPGTRIEIRDEAELFASSDTLQKPILNLAWHISNEIRQYLKGHGYCGQVIDIISEGDF